MLIKDFWYSTRVSCYLDMIMIILMIIIVINYWWNQGGLMWLKDVRRPIWVSLPALPGPAAQQDRTVWSHRQPQLWESHLPGEFMNIMTFFSFLGRKISILTLSLDSGDNQTADVLPLPAEKTALIYYDLHSPASLGLHRPPTGPPHHGWLQRRPIYCEKSSNIVPLPRTTLFGYSFPFWIIPK